MKFTDQITEIRKLVSQAKSVTIVTHEKPNADSVGSSLALFLALSAQGKSVRVMCPDPVTVEMSSFIGADKVGSTLTSKNFVISLDYVEGSIEKVSYNIEGDKFNLVIEPRDGFPPFDEKKVSYTQGGASADVIICVDTIHLGGLKSLYESNKELFASKPVINIDRHPNNMNYGKVNIIDPKASSSAELVWQVIQGVNGQMTSDIATNLLNAVYDATSQFGNPSTSADAFSLAAACVKAGGRRFRSGGKSPEPVEESKEETHDDVSEKKNLEEVSVPVKEQHVDQMKEGHMKTSGGEALEGRTPADWLKPKIFKSSNT